MQPLVKTASPRIHSLYNRCHMPKHHRVHQRTKEHHQTRKGLLIIRVRRNIPKSNARQTRKRKINRRQIILWLFRPTVNLPGVRPVHVWKRSVDIVGQVENPASGWQFVEKRSLDRSIKTTQHLDVEGISIDLDIFSTNSHYATAVKIYRIGMGSCFHLIPAQPEPETGQPVRYNAEHNHRNEKSDTTVVVEHLEFLENSYQPD